MPFSTNYFKKTSLIYACSALIATSLAFYACTKKITPGSVSSSIPPTATPQDQYVSTLTGVALGSVEVSGVANGRPYGGSKASNGADNSVDVNGAISGDEANKSCGTQWTISQARSDASFTVQHDNTRRTFGFNISSSAFGKGGFWRGKIGIICKGSNNTIGSSSAKASGRLDLIFNAPSGVTDRLLIRVNGASPSEVNLQVKDGNNKLLPLQGLANGQGSTVELATPGAYTVSATTTVSASNGGGGNAFDQRSQNVSVSVQSLRDALSLGFGQPATESLLIPIPISVSIEGLTDLVKNELFKDNGKFYPCRPAKNCDGKGEDLYLENPKLSIMGGALVLEAHLSGHYNWFIFNPGLTGNLRLSAKPVIENQVLRFDRPIMETASNNAIVKYVSPRAAKRITDKVSAMRINLTPILNSALAKAQAKFPIKWGPACLLLNVNELKMRGLELKPSPPSLIGYFGAVIEVGPGDACNNQ